MYYIVRTKSLTLTYSKPDFFKIEMSFLYDHNYILEIYIICPYQNQILLSEVKFWMKVSTTILSNLKLKNSTSFEFTKNLFIWAQIKWYHDMVHICIWYVLFVSSIECRIFCHRIVTLMILLLEVFEGILFL